MVMRTLLISAGITSAIILGRNLTLSVEPNVGQQIKSIIGTGSRTNIQVLENFSWQKVLLWICVLALVFCIVVFVVFYTQLMENNPQKHSVVIIGIIIFVIIAILIINVQTIIAIVVN